MPLFDIDTMDDKIEVFATPVAFSTEKPPPYNPLKRPDISYKKPILCLVGFIIGIVLLALIPSSFPIQKWLLIPGFIALYGAIFLKKAIIWSVHFYQNKASDKTRLRCVFEPSCSEYMLLAVKKYGVIKGVFKGLKRLLRCHPPNGGKDYP